jgi:hypothetical protein
MADFIGFILICAVLVLCKNHTSLLDKITDVIQKG